MQCCIVGQTQIAQKIIDKKADLTKLDKSKRSSLSYAVLHKRNDLVLLMLESGAKANIESKLFCECTDSEIIMALLNHGFRLNNNAMNKNQPWYKAIKHLVDPYQQRMARTRGLMMEKFSKNEKIVGKLMNMLAEKSMEKVLEAELSNMSPAMIPNQTKEFKPQAKQFQQ